MFPNQRIVTLAAAVAARLSVDDGPGDSGPSIRGAAVAPSASPVQALDSACTRLHSADAAELVKAVDASLESFFEVHDVRTINVTPRRANPWVVAVIGWAGSTPGEVAAMTKWYVTMAEEDGGLPSVGAVVIGVPIVSDAAGQQAAQDRRITDAIRDAMKESGATRIVLHCFRCVVVAPYSYDLRPERRGSCCTASGV